MRQQAVRPSRMTRFNEIINILVQNDFWDLVKTLLVNPEGTGEVNGQSAPARVRRILEDLGPSFIKIGQLLATRPDLIPDAYVKEFKKLYDKTTPSPFTEVRQTIRAELGQEIEEIFQSFDEEAIASASVGQVHRAVLKDGTNVAVKVQHAGIEDSMRLDFEILRGLVTFIEKTFAASRVWQPTDHLEELRQMLERELDYAYEMKNTLRVADNFRTDPTVHIPKMYREHCSRRVMVMEYIDGIRFANVDAPEMQGINRRRVAKIVTHAMAKQIFLDRIFHADPSPGNMMILSSNKVAFLDFGAVGMVTERRAKNILHLITSISKKDVENTAEAVTELCDSSGELNRKQFLGDIEKILDFFEREQLSVADPRIMEMILDLANKHQMLLPPDFMLITRALFQFDGFCRELDPDFELVSVLEPFVARLLWHNISNPTKQKELLSETVGELLRFGRTFPHTANSLLKKIERNELSTRVEVAGMEGMKRSQGRGVLKMAFTVVVAALIVGLAVVYAGPDPDAAVGRYLFLAGAIIIGWALVLVLWSESMKGRRD